MLVLAMPGVEDILLVFLLLASYSDLGSSTSEPCVYRCRPEVSCLSLFTAVPSARALGRRSQHSTSVAVPSRTRGPVVLGGCRYSIHAVLTRGADHRSYRQLPTKVLRASGVSRTPCGSSGCRLCMGWESSRRIRQACLKRRYRHRAEVASKSRPALSLPALPPYRGKGRL